MNKISIDELLEKQRKKRIREREKYANSISSKKSKKSTKKDRSKFDEDREIIPTVPTLPAINNISPYAGEKKDAQWLYQQPQQQNSFNYYDSQPMTPLESSYSLQRNPTKYSPYNEAFYSNNTNVPSNAYIQQNSTQDYYYTPSTQQQYSNNITSPPLNNNNNSNYYKSNNNNTEYISKPNTYDDISEQSSATAFNNSTPKLRSINNEDINSRNYPQAEKMNDVNSAFWNQETNPRQEVNTMQDDGLFAYYNENNAGNNTSIHLQDQYFHNDQQYFDNTSSNTKKKDPVYSHYI